MHIETPSFPHLLLSAFAAETLAIIRFQLQLTPATQVVEVSAHSLGVLPSFAQHLNHHLWRSLDSSPDVLDIER
jgi:hypothetical protein